MKINWKRLIVCLIIPLAVGVLAAIITRDGMNAFEGLSQPDLSPPMSLFPVVWTILYLLMGTASYITLHADTGKRRPALTVYGVQLAANFVWSILFFNLQAFFPAFLWLIVLWILILATTIMFWRIRKSAGWLMLPYLLWVTFAGYLNYGVYMLN